MPIPLLDKVKKELQRLCQLGVLKPVEEPTQYVSPIVVVPKDKTVRICGDYTHLNKNIARPVYPIPKVEVTLARLRGSEFYSKIDATSGFLQIPLDKASAKLTTIITPFGRFMYNRLPFGLNCAPEYFSMKFSQLFEDFDNVVIHMDDVLLYTKNLEEHKQLLTVVLTRLHKAGITINRSKCVFAVPEVRYLGHIINKDGIRPEPERIEAINKFKTPESKKEVMQFLGMINFVSRFIPDKTDTLEPLYSLLKKKVRFVWDIPQKIAFEKIKLLLQEAPILAHYDPSKKIIVSADSSSYGLGAMLTQVNEDGSKSIVAYASRTLSDTEKRYSQIEKECLALVWAVERFKDYVYGISLHLETDHKPLVQILQTKPIDDLTPRLMRLRMRLMRYQYTVEYVPGKLLAIPDALSRNPLNNKQDWDRQDRDIKGFINGIAQNIPVGDVLLERIKQEQSRDEICNKIKEYTSAGWPEKNKTAAKLKDYIQYNTNFSVVGNLLLYNSRIVVPETMQKEILFKIHEGHLGISKCRNRAQQTVWWLGISTQIETFIKNCPKCVEQRQNPREDIIIEPLPSRPWKKIGIDLFHYNGTWYMAVTDYYSHYLEIKKMYNLNESYVIYNSVQGTVFKVWSAGNNQNR